MRADSVSEHPAGKGVNVARILDVLGVSSVLYGFIGEDRSDFFRDFLTHTKVRYSLTELPIKTRVNTTIQDTKLCTETHIRESGERICESDYMTLISKLCTELPTGACCLLSGSLPIGISDVCFVNGLELLIKSNINVMLDMQGAILRQAVRYPIKLIKPNEDEFRELLDNYDDDFISLCKNFMRQYPNIDILASFGSFGAFLGTDGNLFHGKLSYPVNVTGTVGAGDALLAGYLAANAFNKTSAEKLKCAIQTATAAVAVGKSGAIDTSFLNANVRVVPYIAY